jgi:hypothetical protein
MYDVCIHTYMCVYVYILYIDTHIAYCIVHYRLPEFVPRRSSCVQICVLVFECTCVAATRMLQRVQ